eukprot:m.141164 g.141164  ORF g.141164 m.141164 type:complete len:70 (+) comp17106_c2_seq1:113-322(+)
MGVVNPMANSFFLMFKWPTCTISPIHIHNATNTSTHHLAHQPPVHTTRQAPTGRASLTNYSLDSRHRNM